MSVEDTRRPAYGVGRVLILVYAVLALAATGRSLYQMMTKLHDAPLAYTLSAVAAVIYIVATVALAHNGRRMRKVAWTAVVIECVGVWVVGGLSLVHPELFPDETVWSQFGAGYGYVPAVLPILGMIWLYRSSPVRIEKLAE